MNTIKADARQLALLKALPTCHTLIDIGTDHGKLPALALKHGKCKKAILVDISEGSLNKAKKLFLEQKLEGTFIVSDGLTQVEESFDCLVIAGMGSYTLCHILEQNLDKWHNATLVLSPNVKQEETRQFLKEHHYSIEHEYIVMVGHKLYCIMVANKTALPLNEKEVFIGRIYEKNSTELVKRYLKQKEKETLDVLNGFEQAKLGDRHMEPLYRQRLTWLKEELKHLCL